jgi:hypothetical protein
VTARIFLSCAEHPDLLVCDDDEAFRVETVAAARALWAAKHPGKNDTKVARVVIDCEIGGCSTRAIVRADSIEQGRVKASGHDYAWYVARRAGGQLVDGCQWHLGTCCVHHAHRLWRGRPHPTLDPAAVLPGEPGFPGQNDSAPTSSTCSGVEEHRNENRR